MTGGAVLAVGILAANGAGGSEAATGSGFRDGYWLLVQSCGFPESVTDLGKRGRESGEFLSEARVARFSDGVDIVFASELYRQRNGTMDPIFSYFKVNTLLEAARPYDASPEPRQNPVKLESSPAPIRAVNGPDRVSRQSSIALESWPALIRAANRRHKSTRLSEIELEPGSPPLWKAVKFEAHGKEISEAEANRILRSIPRPRKSPPKITYAII